MELLRMGRALIGQQQFGLARRLLGRIPADSLPADEAREARQKRALATYKDPDTPVSVRLRRALEILADGEDLATTTCQETLGLAGAILKRRWELTTRISDLEDSFSYYHRGYEQGVDDGGYTAINAAFVLDLLTAAEAGERGEGDDADREENLRRDIADEIRAGIVERLAPRAAGPRAGGDWWLYATLGEAQLGLGDYGEAKRWLELCGAASAVPDWQVESAVSQIGALCDLRARDEGGKLDPGALAALEALLGEYREAVTTAHAGKVGIALSGGGFRASFFHIGVLARLAELDMLRHVDVLSCVSGGSILGAHYYLELQRLLEAKPDTEIGREDYIGIVARIETGFLEGVGKNIRMRVMGDPLSNLRAMLSPHWTRTQRAGRQYEKHLYSRVEVGRDRDRREMEDLLMKPAGEDSGREDGRPHFNPKWDNWKRRCKVPVLVINASTLNTGHNWQFTGSWMGEPPAVVDEDIDANPRLRRLYYSEAPRRWRDLRLGDAVAASACVPGLFEPLVLDDLFAETSVELVDGGVHDNQGVASLIEQECTVAIVSDASGQMTFQQLPGRGPLAVPLRSSSVLSARVREAQLREMLTRRASSALRGLLLVHLRKGLAQPPEDWIDCPEPYDPADDLTLGRESAGYGVPQEVQERLAALRTDLDAFSEMEAYTLMLSGYRMARASFATSISGFPLDDGAPHPWRFHEVAAAVDHEGSEHQRLLRVLEVGSQRWFKVWRLYPGLRWASAALGLAVLAVLVWLLWSVRGVAILTPGAILVAAAVVVAALASRRLFTHRLDPAGALTRFATGLALIAASPVAFLQIHLLDRLYRRAGRVDAG
ncbi:MAG: patatin-like phospholipase family protein [Solirubrobacterales bacterium]